MLDFGHQRTNICFVRGGDPIFARTIRRGGEHLTAAIAKAFNADAERAEQAKRDDAFLRQPGAAGDHAAGREAGQPCCARRWRRSIRELRQTLASFRAGNRFDVDALLVVGGGGRLAGLLPFLEAELGIPARYPVDPPGAGIGRRSSPPTSRARRAPRPKSDSHALAGGDRDRRRAGGSREIDFRRGPFVYRASFSILRQKAAAHGGAGGCAADRGRHRRRRPVLAR